MESGTKNAHEYLLKISCAFFVAQKKEYLHERQKPSTTPGL